LVVLPLKASVSSGAGTEESKRRVKISLPKTGDDVDGKGINVTVITTNTHTDEGNDANDDDDDDDDAADDDIR
jgi:hypothetical protein